MRNGFCKRGRRLIPRWSRRPLTVLKAHQHSSIQTTPSELSVTSHNNARQHLPQALQINRGDSLLSKILHLIEELDDVAEPQLLVLWPLILLERVELALSDLGSVHSV